MMHKATELISETFDRYNVKYRIIEEDKLSLVEAGYNIEGGPSVRILYLSTDEGNGVQVRILGLMNKVPAEKRSAVLEVCNRINSEMRFFKFYLDKDRDLMALYDLPARGAEENIGECSFEMFIRATQILNKCYHYIPEAVYGTSPDEKEKAFSDALSALKYLREHPIAIPPKETDAQ